MDQNFLIACHECDLLNKFLSLPKGCIARCSRCGAVLYRHKTNSIDRTLALTITGLILFVIANVYPFLGFKLGTQMHETTLITGVRELYHQGMWPLATVVLFTIIVIPAAQLMGLFYVLVPLRLNRRSWKIKDTFRFIQYLQPWAMMEVFMLGILVSVVKLSSKASILPGIAMFAFMVLIFILAASIYTLDPHMVWKRLGHLS
jgi:paraquat-inducible protein A